MDRHLTGTYWKNSNDEKQLAIVSGDVMCSLRACKDLNLYIKKKVKEI